jgi:hypothetical protein
MYKRSSLLCATLSDEEKWVERLENQDGEDLNESVWKSLIFQNLVSIL